MSNVRAQVARIEAEITGMRAQVHRLRDQIATEWAWMADALRAESVALRRRLLAARGEGEAQALRGEIERAETARAVAAARAELARGKVAGQAEG